MKKLLTVLIFVFLSATVAAHEFSLNLGYDEIYQMAKSPANQSGASHFLVPAPTKTVTRSNTEALLIAANSGDSRNQQKQSDVYKPGRNHDRKAKSKYDLRDIDGKRGGDGDKHVHKHDSHDNKPKSKYDLREIGGHKHGEGQITTGMERLITTTMGMITITTVRPTTMNTGMIIITTTVRLITMTTRMIMTITQRLRGMITTMLGTTRVGMTTDTITDMNMGDGNHQKVYMIGCGTW